MADPADRNNQQGREDGAEDKRPNKTSKSGKAEGAKQPAPEQQQQQQQQQQQRQPRQQRRAPRQSPRAYSPPPPPLGVLARRALRVCRQFLQQSGRPVLALPLATRILFIADKARSCLLQALRWAMPTHLTTPRSEDVELPASPAGLSLDGPVKELLRRVQNSLKQCGLIIVRCPGIQEMLDQLNCYRRELQGLQPARPHTVELSPAKAQTPGSILRMQSTEEQKSTEGAVPRPTEGAVPRPTEGAVPISTEGAVPSSAAVEQSKVTPPPSDSSSSSSSSASTGSITEEVLRPYYSPPRFIHGWKERSEKRHKKEENDVKEDERKCSEHQDDNDQPASPAEDAGFIFGPPSSSSSEEPPATQEGSQPPAQRPATRVPKRLFLNLFGLKMA